MAPACVSTSDPEGTKCWIQIIAVRGKRRHIGLGPYPLISLKEAREKARANKRFAHEGKTPLKNVPASSVRRTSRCLLSKSSRFSPRTTPAGSQRRNEIRRSRATPARRSAASGLMPSPSPMPCRASSRSGERSGKRHRGCTSASPPSLRRRRCSGAELTIRPRKR